MRTFILWHFYKTVLFPGLVGLKNQKMQKKKVIWLSTWLLELEPLNTLNLYIGSVFLLSLLPRFSYLSGDVHFLKMN